MNALGHVLSKGHLNGHWELLSQCYASDSDVKRVISGSRNHMIMTSKETMTNTITNSDAATITATAYNKKHWKMPWSCVVENVNFILPVDKTLGVTRIESG